MNERDKIIKVINSIIPGRKVFYGEREYTVGDVADALIANGIGDVESYKIEAEYWEKSYNEEHVKYVNFVKNEARDMKNMMKSRNEWKCRAEVAERNDKIKERALRKICKKEVEYLSTTQGLTTKNS